MSFDCPHLSQFFLLSVTFTISLCLRPFRTDLEEPHIYFGANGNGVYRHQLVYGVQDQLPPPMTGIVFESITQEHLDDGLVSCIKYFLSYSFYKFGLEVRKYKERSILGKWASGLSLPRH